MTRGPQGLPPQRGLGKAIRHLRETAGLTQKALAERSEISASWISRIEDGQVDPTWAAVRKLAAALDVSVEAVAELAEGFEEDKPGSRGPEEEP